MTSGAIVLRTLQAALGLVVVVGGDADRLDHAQVQFARDDRRRHQAAAGDRDDAASNGPEPASRQASARASRWNWSQETGKGFLAASVMALLDE